LVLAADAKPGLIVRSWAVGLRPTAAMQNGAAVTAAPFVAIGGRERSVE
jgi:hypothetical protein